jgi:lysophospholipase L1-like esterase
MKNHNKKVLLFISLSFFSLLVASLFSGQLSLYWPLFSNVDILADIKSFPESTPIVSTRSVPTAGKSTQSDSLTALSADADSLSFNQYLLPGVITNFKSDTTRPALPQLMKKLEALQRGQKVKVRIAWFGDSLIEGDLITQTVRELLQDNFSGNHGVGFVPFKSITSGFRISAIARSSGTWADDNFKTRSYKEPLFLSGHVFYSPSGQLSLRDNTVKDSAQVLEKWLICGPVDSNTVITVNKSSLPIAASHRFNRILIDRSQKTSLNFTGPSKWMALYGVSCEPEYGVMIDNFSFRGISGFELGRFDEEFLDEISQSGIYDLIVIQYGVNVMFRAYDKNYDYYLKGMEPALKKLKQHFPHTEFLMVSCSDRAFRYGTEWKTAVGMDSLLKTQATLACKNGITFFNLYQTMGGSGTIVKWVEGPERLASKDYIHPSPRGAVVLGNLFYHAFMNDYHKLTRKSVYH